MESSTHRMRRRLMLALATIAIIAPPQASSAASFRVLAWNNLGMHCMDDDFSVFSLLPPYNTLGAQVTRDGVLVTDPSRVSVTYQAVADPSGSINTSSANKTNFWTYAGDLYGAVGLPVDLGLASYDMPGAGNVPQSFGFDPLTNAWIAEGIPITPYDDAGARNPYPLMRIEVRDPVTHALLTQVDSVLPVSDEMDCRGCHASGSGPDAQPIAGWVNEPDAARDHRLNILRLHDEKQAANPVFAHALETRGYDAAGLFATATSGGTPILCAGCHLSNALPGTGLAGVSSLTQALHTGHATAIDDRTGLALGDSENRSACYNCHPGSVTRCLRGAMGAAVAADGTLAMQCQDCHGSMHEVGAAGRVGWLDEPTCQNCHTGSATHNNGQIRYTNVFDAPGHRRNAVDALFATTPNAPVAPFSLYRFSSGHGGLQCEACHDSTHAEAPSSHRNDNLKAVAIQGHKGMISECSSCHPSLPSTTTGGPHGLHSFGAGWIADHHDVAEHGGNAACRSCHGPNDRGTVLSRAQADRSFSTRFGVKNFWRGFQVSCYSCHNGPSSSEPSPNHPAVVANVTTKTMPDVPIAIPLPVSDADGDPVALRIVSQPVRGTVGLAGSTATYFPEAGFAGSATFTFAANDGKTDSNLGSARVVVGSQPSCGVGAELALVLAAIRARSQRRGRTSSP